MEFISILLLIIITILVIGINIYISLNKTETFIDNPLLSDKPYEEQTNFEFDKLTDEMKKELYSTYNIYDNEKLKNFNDNAAEYDLV